jgi:hypothetical protein
MDYREWAGRLLNGASKYFIGTRFIHSSGEVYILAQVDGLMHSNEYYSVVGLISLRTGNRWSNPVVVKENVQQNGISKFYIHSQLKEFNEVSSSNS